MLTVLSPKYLLHTNVCLSLVWELLFQSGDTLLWRLLYYFGCTANIATGQNWMLRKRLTISSTGVLVKQYEKVVGTGNKPHECVHSRALELLTGTQIPGCESFQGRYIHRTLLHQFKMSREASQRRWSWSWILNTWVEERKDILVTGKASADTWSYAPSVVCLGISKPLHVAGIRGMYEQQEAKVGENHECLVCHI